MKAAMKSGDFGDVQQNLDAFTKIVSGVIAIKMPDPNGQNELKSILDDGMKHINHETGCFISDVRAMPEGNQSDKLQQRAETAKNSIGDKFDDTTVKALNIIDDMPEDSASQDILSMIIKGVQNYARNPIQTGSEEITDGLMLSQRILLRSLTRSLDSCYAQKLTEILPYIPHHYLPTNEAPVLALWSFFQVFNSSMWYPGFSSHRMCLGRE